MIGSINGIAKYIVIGILAVIAPLILVNFQAQLAILWLMILFALTWDTQGAAEVRPAEVRPAEVRRCFGILIPPPVPFFDAALQDLEMFRVGHGGLRFGGESTA